MINVIYDRDYSTNEKAKDERKATLKSIAKENGYKIDKEYLDYSKDEKVIKLEQLKQDVEKGIVDCVIVKSLDRLSRNAKDIKELMNRLENNNGKLFITEDKELKEISSFYINFFSITEEGVKKQNLIKSYRGRIRGQSIDENIFESKLKDKPIKLGYLLSYYNSGNIITSEENMLGISFNDFSFEQLKTSFIPRELRKNDEGHFDIVVDFIKEKDKELFADKILPEYEDEFEM